MYICVHMCARCLWKSGEGIESPGTGLWTFVNCHVGLGMNPGPLQEQEFFKPEPFLQPSPHATLDFYIK